jgi:hypothetical protein
MNRVYIPNAKVDWLAKVAARHGLLCYINEHAWVGWLIIHHVFTSFTRGSLWFFLFKITRGRILLYIWESKGTFQTLGNFK